MAKESQVNLWRTNDQLRNRSLVSEEQKVVANLTGLVRQIIGLLWSYGPCSVDMLAKILFLEEPEERKQIAKLLREILKSKEPAVRDALAGKFTIEAIIEIPIGGMRVRCRQCNQLLTKVPCCKCFLARLQFNQKRRARQIKGSLPQSNDPTRALPGSREKIEIMKQRAALGFSVFCRGDIRCRPKPLRVRKRP